MEKRENQAVKLVVSAPLSVKGLVDASFLIAIAWKVTWNFPEHPESHEMILTTEG